MSNAKTWIEQRAAGIASCIRTIRLGSDLAEVERGFAEEIIQLVLEATNGTPKPVLPHRADLSLEPWEGKVWGIFHLGASELRPAILFLSEAGARIELEQRQGLPEDDDNRLPTEDIGVLSGEAAMLFWNSNDPDPRTAAEKPPLRQIGAGR